MLKEPLYILYESIIISTYADMRSDFVVIIKKWAGQKLVN